MSARQTGIRADHTVPGGDDLGPSGPLPSGEAIAVWGDGCNASSARESCSEAQQTGWQGSWGWRSGAVPRRVTDRYRPPVVGNALRTALRVAGPLVYCEQQRVMDEPFDPRTEPLLGNDAEAV